MPFGNGVETPAGLVILSPLLPFLLQGPTIPASYFFSIDEILIILFLVKMYFVGSHVCPPRQQCGGEFVIYPQSHRLAGPRVSEADPLQRNVFWGKKCMVT